MPSAHHPNQAVLFCLTLQETWVPLAASGTFVLPYLREMALRGEPLDLRQWFSSSIVIERNDWYLWEGELYVEYIEATTSPMTPDRVEWAGHVRQASLDELSAYIMLKDTTSIGPIEPNVASPPPTTET